MDLSPKQIVNELDKYIIGQADAKKAVAIALRNRYRRSQLSPELMEEITPKNILMKGATGVGKTEIARRLAKIVRAPFVKVEATTYTEVGYVGKDVEGMVRDLAECSYRLVKEEKTKEVSLKATKVAEKKVMKILLDMKKADQGDTPQAEFEKNVLESLRQGVYDNLVIEMDVAEEAKNMELIPGGAAINLGSIFGEVLPKKKKKRKLTVKEAMKLTVDEEADKLIDNDAVTMEALKRAENDGIIFIDEIDKIAASSQRGGADVSREGVQRDILPIVEGCTVMTKYGPIKTDYILFIAAGAFQIAKMEDLIPELQGRFPVKVELASLTKEDFVQILTNTQNAITTQYKMLLAVDNIDLSFTPEAIDKIAEVSVQVNESSEDLGARRLHTVMEYLLEDISFNAGGGNYPVVPITIDAQYVETHLAGLTKDRDLKKYVL